MELEGKIGFDKVRAAVKAACGTKYALSRVDRESISCDSDEILLRLRLTDEMRLICMFEDSFPTDGYTDSRDFLLPLAAEMSCIDLPSIVTLRTMLDTLRRVIGFFRSNEGLYPNLEKMTEPVAYFPEIQRRIDNIIDRYGEVRDNASEELTSIRRTLRSKEGSINRIITSILKRAQDEGLVDEGASVSVRDGKTLIPIASANKKRLPGLVYDESASGRTSYVEPFEVVELNNEIRALQYEEQREIFRILSEFTEFLRPYLPEVTAASEYLGELDFILAKARVAISMRAGLPIISDNGEMTLRRARHPLLEKALAREGKEISPLTVALNREKRILLISGPNAGGKSVCLKTVGLLQYMFQWGLLIPTSEISEMLVFRSIYIDIGDDQSLENDLSTYSSHLTNLRQIVTGADGQSLVLIDEFGSGTEPAAGGAIAEAVLAQLERSGAYGVITTHYTNLKLYASNSKGVANGAMLFDSANIKPLFKLEQGLPGNSFAFELARKMGLPESIVKDAEERVGNDFVDMERQLRKIARNRKALDEKLTRIRNTDKTLEGLTEKYQKELVDIKALRKSILDEARAEAKEIVAGANRRIEQTIREIREAQAEKEKTKSLRAEVKQLAEELENPSQKETDLAIEKKMEQIIARKERERKRKEERARKAGAPVGGNLEKRETPAEDAPLKVGDKVKVKGNDMVGEITRLSKSTAYVAIGSIISRLDISKIERISSQKYKENVRRNAVPAPPSVSASISERRLNFSPDIDIRGERLTEALEIVTRFIDDACMVGMPEVRILHGKGNGVLREEIRKYLKTMPAVASFADEDIQRGGAGITVVKMDI